MEKNEILNSDCDVRYSAAGNPNTPAATLVELAKDSDCDVRRSAAGNPNTPAATLVELAKDSNCGVRRSAAGNPNTPAATLVELAKDSDCGVRRSAAGNPNTPAEYRNLRKEFTITEAYIAIKGTNHVWYKYNSENVAPFYVCGCFRGSREQLLARIYSTDNWTSPSLRMQILNALDLKFKEVFGK